MPLGQVSPLQLSGEETLTPRASCCLMLPLQRSPRSLPVKNPTKANPFSNQNSRPLAAGLRLSRDHGLPEEERALASLLCWTRCALPRAPVGPFPDRRCFASLHRDLACSVPLTASSHSFSKSTKTERPRERDTVWRPDGTPNRTAQAALVIPNPGYVKRNPRLTRTAGLQLGRTPRGQAGAPWERAFGVSHGRWAGFLLAKTEELLALGWPCGENTRWPLMDQASGVRMSSPRPASSHQYQASLTVLCKTTVT